MWHLSGVARGTDSVRPNCGCSLVFAGFVAGAVAGAAYVNGNVSATYFAYPNDVWMATRQGLTELGMPLSKESFDGFKGSLETSTSAGDKVSVQAGVHVAAWTG